MDIENRFIIKRFKPASEISWLKDIKVALVKRYYVEIAKGEADVNDPVNNGSGLQIGFIENMIFKDDKEFALINLDTPLNFDTLIQIGVPIENMIFETFNWVGGDKDILINKEDNLNIEFEEE